MKGREDERKDGCEDGGFEGRFVSFTSFLSCQSWQEGRKLRCRYRDVCMCVCVCVCACLHTLLPIYLSLNY